MTRPYSLAFKQKMVQRLTGKNAVSALQLSRESGLQQQCLSRWLQEARSLPLIAREKHLMREWTVEQKAQVIAEGSQLSGEQLSDYLARKQIKLADFERWRVALADEGSITTARRIRQLERELARKEKALAEAAALLVLKKTVQSLDFDEDTDGDEPNEKP